MPIPDIRIILLAVKSFIEPDAAYRTLERRKLEEHS
jgi:hypothetical protein